MKTVLLRAPVLTCSGYGVHARQIAKWLFAKEEELGLDITVEALHWGNTGWLVDVEAEEGLVGRILQATENRKPFYDITIQLQLPNEWNPMLGSFNIGITAGVETDKCNPKWIEAVNNMHLVIVPSHFTKQTFLNSGPVSTKIVVIPESFIEEVKTPEKHKIDLSHIPTEFNFLVFGQITGNNPENDRKNLPYTLKWMSSVFANRPDIGVIIKTNMLRNSKIDKLATQNALMQILSGVQQGPGPRFYLLHGAMTNSELVGLYSHPKVKALVSLTHGEGYGLPTLEAAATGLPVIATGWSGHLDFLKQGKFCKVDCRLAPVHESRVDGQIFMPGAQWAYPVESEAKRQLLKFVESPNTPKQWALELRQSLLALYSPEAINQQYDNLLLPYLEK